jgi:hypothetical protein
MAASSLPPGAGCVLWGASLEDVLRRFRKRIEAADIQPQLLLLDRGYFRVAVVCFCKRRSLGSEVSQPLQRSRSLAICQADNPHSMALRASRGI